MTEQQIEDLLTAFTNSLRFEQPLDFNQPADEQLYVPRLHGDTDAVGRLQRDILRLAGGGVFLFTGQPGSGKSTELRRLQRQLRDKGCKVYYCDLEEWLNLNAPVTLSSFLVALLSSWVDQVGAIQGQRTPAERLISFFTQTRLIPENLKLDAAAGPIKSQIQFALQSDVDFRAALEANLKSQLSSIVAQAHALVGELKADLCSQGERCVLLADSIEKIRGYGDDASKVFESMQRLFVGEGAALQLPGVHVVYSVSPFLLEQNPHLPAALGTGFVVNMPSVHVFSRGGGDADEAGLAAVQSIVERRFPRCTDVFTRDQLRRLAQQTGGDLRDFLRAIRVALSDDIDRLPLKDSTVDYALGHITPSKTIPVEHLKWLAALDQSHEAELAGDINATLLQRYLASKHVLAYLNGDTWYAVHPMLQAWVRQRAAAVAAAPAAGG